MGTTNSLARAARLLGDVGIAIAKGPQRQVQALPSGHSNSKQQHQPILKPGTLLALSALATLDHRNEEQQPLRLPPDEAGSGTAGPTRHVRQVTSSVDDAKP
jgi:hypothetical protein